MTKLKIAQQLGKLGGMKTLKRYGKKHFSQMGKMRKGKLINYKIKDYGLGGRNNKRELIREYFNYTCQKCGKKWKKGERRFDVHHIGMGSKKSHRYDDFRKLKEILNMVMLLCHKCHLNLIEHRKAMEKNHKNHWSTKQLSPKKTKKMLKVKHLIRGSKKY